jgi:hypothetical protein
LSSEPHMIQAFEGSPAYDVEPSDSVSAVSSVWERKATMAVVRFRGLGQSMGVIHVRENRDGYGRRRSTPDQLRRVDLGGRVRREEQEDRSRAVAAESARGIGGLPPASKAVTSF